MPPPPARPSTLRELIELATYPFLAGSLALAAQGKICFLLHGPTLAASLAWAGWLGGWRLLARVRPSVRCAHRLRRAVWSTPLAFLALQAGLLSLALAVPRWVLADPDLFPRWVGLPGPQLAPLVVTLFLQAFVATGGVARDALLAYLAALQEGAPLPAADPLARRVFLGLVVAALGLTAVLIQASWRPAALARAALARNLGRPDRARLELEAASQVPGGFQDSALFRLARLHRRRRADPARARALLARLEHEHPRSPWRDDAAFEAAQAARDLRDLAGAIEALEGFDRRFPGSPWVGPALVLRARLLVEVGRREEAAGAWSRLTTSPAVLMDPTRYPRDIVPVADLAREALAWLGGETGESLSGQP